MKTMLSLSTVLTLLVAGVAFVSVDANGAQQVTETASSYHDEWPSTPVAGETSGHAIPLRTGTR